MNNKNDINFYKLLERSGIHRNKNIIQIMKTNLTFSEIQIFVNKNWGFKASLLHLAVRQDDIDLVRLCICYGADVNMVDKDGNTALFYSKSLDVTKCLVENGTDINILNLRGKTAVVYLYRRNNESCKYLIPLTDLDLTGIYCNTWESYTLLGAMIEHEESDPSLIQMVIDRTKNLNKLHMNGDSYLIRAARTPKIKTLTLSLVKAGCDLYIRNSEGKNFYDLAYKYVQTEIGKNYPEFMHCRDMTDQQRERYLKLNRLKSLDD